MVGYNIMGRLPIIPGKSQWVLAGRGFRLSTIIPPRGSLFHADQQRSCRSSLQSDGMSFGANCRQSAYDRSMQQSLRYPLEGCSVLRIAVLGCGRIGRMHAANVAAHPRAKLVSVYDTHRPSAEEVAARNGITAAESADAIFGAGDIDAVLIDVT